MGYFSNFKHDQLPLNMKWRDVGLFHEATLQLLFVHLTEVHAFMLQMLFDVSFFPLHLSFFLSPCLLASSNFCYLIIVIRQTD